MNRTLALEAAPPDATGTRWAVATRGERTFLAARWPDGREVIEIRHPPESHRRAYRVARPPKNLNWQPVTQSVLRNA